MPSGPCGGGGAGVGDGGGGGGGDGLGELTGFGGGGGERLGGGGGGDERRRRLSDEEDEPTALAQGSSARPTKTVAAKVVACMANVNFPWAGRTWTRAAVAREDPFCDFIWVHQYQSP